MPTPGDPPADDPSPADGARSGRKRGGARPASSKGGGATKGDKILRVERRTTTVVAEGEAVMIPSLAAPAWEFVHPRCARRRLEDMEEVEAMIEAGEPDIAREELVWLLSECPDFLDAHLQLGLMALEEDDPKLARGHFGRAVELGFRAIEAAGHPRPLPYSLPGNRAFFEAAKGLGCSPAKDPIDTRRTELVPQVHVQQRQRKHPYLLHDYSLLHIQLKKSIM
jgi:hypothetical protein